MQSMLSGGKIELNAEFNSALKAMEDGTRSLFITGKAGSGKSTLLLYFKSVTRKKVAVIAPTGVAALNVGGQTIHSFCRFKPDITLDKVEILSGTAKNMYKGIDTIMIDEISMVRSDLFDCLDKFMRLNGKRQDLPFGGVQLILIGDLYQLSPVIAQEEKEIFENHYKSEYFFDAKAFANLDLEFIELKAHYRQSDLEFIRLLNAIRDKTATQSDLDRLNKRVNASFGKVQDGMQITLTTTNSIADSMNFERLKLIKKEPSRYDAFISGKFNKGAYPADEHLLIKEGAQVMMLNNDLGKRWVNGSLAEVESIERGDQSNKDGITVRFEDGRKSIVFPFTWKASRLSYDKIARKIVSTEIGSFTQYPMTLAWAVTIHKSQGKTFERVIIDMGSGAFAHGQLYVALSRCTSLEGIILNRSLRSADMIMDNRIYLFHKEHFK